MENQDKSLVLSDLFKTNFEAFSTLDSDSRKSQIRIINYIDTIARELEKDIGSINLLEILPHTNGILTANNMEINKALASFENTKTSKPTIDITPEMVETFKAINNRTFTDRLKRIKKEIHCLTEDMEHYQKEYKNNMLIRAEKKRELSHISEVEYEPFSKMIEQIYSEGKFLLREVSENRISFSNVNPIINMHKNDKAKINLRVDLGTFLFSINTCDFSLKVEPFADNLKYNCRYHPHISSCGVICLGNMNELFNEATENRDIFQMLEVANAVMTNYNDDDAYDSLYKFADIGKQVQPNGKVFTNDSGGIRTEYHPIFCSECDYHFDAEVEEGDDFAGYCPECDNYIEVHVG